MILEQDVFYVSIYIRSKLDTTKSKFPTYIKGLFQIICNIIFSIGTISNR